MEAKEAMRKLKHLVYLYFHKGEKSAEYNQLLAELELTDDIVSKAIEDCKGSDDFRGNAMYAIILKDFDANATNEEKAIVFGIFMLYLYIEKHESNKK